MRGSLCQQCFNFNCNWHKEFKPVNGWKATQTSIYGIGDSMCVEKCPEYIPRSKNDYALTTTTELSRMCGMKLRRFMRYLSKCPECIEEILTEKGFNLKIEIEDCAKYNKYYVQKV